jgi:hypothetical protein
MIAAVYAGIKIDEPGSTAVSDDKKPMDAEAMHKLLSTFPGGVFRG